MMMAHCRSGETVLRVETWVFEGLTTMFTVDPWNALSVENFMK